MSPQRRKGATPRNTRGVLQDLAELRNVQAELPDRTSERAEARAGTAQKGRGRPGQSGVDQREFELLTGLSCAVGGELDLGRLARAILDQARRILGAERGILFLGKPDAVGLVPLLAVDIHGEELQEIGKVSRTILARAKAGELVVTGNALADPRFSSILSVRLNQMRSIICGPLVSGSGPVGVLYLDATRAHAFMDGAVEFFLAMAGIAAIALENARLHGELVWENAELRRQRVSFAGSSFDRITGSGDRMHAILRQAEVAARLDDPVLIVGEPGTGRGRLARAIHDASRRALKPFVTCDWSTIPLAHLKGVLWGRSGPAAKTLPHAESGLVRQAEPGSLFLTGAQGLDDELGSAVVRLGERGVFRPMGSRREEHASVRVYLATDPAFLEWRGRSRRIGLVRVAQWFTLTIPPLRERPEDVPTLAADFVRSAAGAAAEAGAVPFFTSEAMDLLRHHPWPGNVRELELVVRQLLLSSPRFPVPAAVVREVLEARGAKGSGMIGPWSGEIRPLREWEDEAIRQALLKTGGNKVAAARLLGVHRNTIGSKTRNPRDY